MSAPGLRFFTSDYQQYKEDTNTVASWLASTARQCGYPEDLLPVEAAQAPRAKKKKSKAKKKKAETAESNIGASNACGSSEGNSQAQVDAPASENSTANGSIKAPGVATPTTTTPSPKTYVFSSVQDFMSLADFIAAKKKPTLKVPRYFAESLDRAISLRKRHSTTVVASRPRDVDSDDRHSYFVGVLEWVKEVLRPSFATTSTKEPRPDINVTVDFANMFSGLSIEEPSQRFEEAPDVVIPKRPLPDLAALQQQEEQEAYLAFSLLIEDFRKIRKALQEDIWGEFKIGYYHALSAALVSNTAIDFARQLEQDMSDVLKKHGGAAKMLEKIWNDTCRNKRQDPDRRERPTDDLNFKVYEEAEDLMIPAYQLLDSFSKEVRSGNIPINGPRDYGRYDPKSDRGSKSARAKYQEDKSLLMQFLPTLAVFCLETHPNGALVEDELTRGLRMVFKTQKISLWNVLSLQVFLDLHHCLREIVTRGSGQLAYALNVVKSSLSMNLKFHAERNLYSENWTRENDGVLRDLIQWIDDNFIDDPVEQTCLRLGRPLPGKKYLLVNNPVLSGLCIYSVQAKFQELGIKISNAFGAVVSAKHLYVAFRKNKMLEGVWTDMEAAMMCQEEDHGPITDDVPVFETFLRRYLIDMGVSVSNFAKDSRGGSGYQRSGAGAKTLKEKANLMRVWKHRFCTESRRVDFTPDELKKIMETTVTWEEDWSSEPEEQETPFGTIKRADISRPVGREGARSLRDPSRAERLQKLPIPQLLKQLGPTLQGEFMEITYDYLILHRFCWQLFERIKSTEDDLLKEMFGFDYIKSVVHLPRMTGYIFKSVVVDEDKFPNPFLNKKRSRGVIDPHIPAMAATHLGAMISSGSGAIGARIASEKYGVAYQFE
ncbi:hypothetical protein HDK90DRAFT_203747 [Phyllosticta capitalensis]|uniref:DUF6604 domain-containing protein n=1 Tax=Phyllosticta capitalensis TaxID=121624 RepID=A0ABR1YS03_9PEZI